MDWSNPDATNFMKHSLQLMQQNPDMLEEFEKHVERVVNNASCHGDRNKLIREHQKAYKENEKLRRYAHQHVSFPNNPFIAKKKFDSEDTCGDKNSALPIPISKLQVDSVHHGRVLRGTLIKRPFLIQGAHCLLEDRSGDVVKVCFYPPELKQDSMSFNDRWMLTQQMFPEGTKIEIFAPFFKVSMDGTTVVRVDNMADVEKKDEWFEASTTPMALNEEGRKHVNALQYEEAVMSYTEAIKCISGACPLYKVLLQNLALVHLNLKQYNTALHYAVGAVLLSPSSSPKGYYRAALALEKLKCPGLAFCFCELAKEQNPSASKDQNFKALYNSLKPNDLKSPRSLRQLEDFWRDIEMIQSLASNPIVSLDLGSQDCSKSPDELKKLGNEHIGNEDYLEAKECYEKALYQLELSHQSVSVATLLSNISLCYLKSGKYHDSFINASFSVTIQPKHKKAHFRRISSLLNLEMIDQARVCFDFGSVALQHDAGCLKELEGRLVPSLQNVPKNKAQSELKTYKPDHAPYQMVEQMNMMIELSGQAGHLLRNIPPFHLEYSKCRKWPIQSDPEKCKAMLCEAHTLGKSDMHRFLLENKPKSMLNQDYFIKRLGTSDQRRLKWLLSTHHGDVSFRERMRYGAGNIHHSFGNVAQQPQVMTTGTTHVSIGFADLQEVILCKLHNSKSGTNQLLRWIGYDQSPYVIAKTLVLIEMMKDKSSAVESVVQVWFSAAWSIQTLKSFRKALQKVVSSLKKKNRLKIPISVQEYLIYWQQHDVSLRESRDQWMANHDSPCSDMICNWKQKRDYLAICTYVMTGQLYYNDLSVGSVVMFALPGGGKVANNENVFEVVDLKELIEHYERTDSEAKDCVHALTSFLESKILTLKERIHSNKITLEVYCEELSLSSSVLIKNICKELQPYSMSWSNVCDYINPKDFHKLARRCSTGNETIHYGYSMNWPLDVKGTFIGDYCLGPENIELKDFITTSLKGSESILKNMWKEYLPSAFKYLTFPVHTNPMNIIDWQLCISEKMYLKWFHLFMDAGDALPERQFRVEMNPFYCFNQRTNSILPFLWTYDSEIEMKPMHTY